jgi:hypothetical protein
MVVLYSSDQMIEFRKHVRLSGNNRAGIIYPGRGEPPIMCTLEDISEGGAGLTVVSTRSVPDTFDLEIKGEEIRRTCRVAWKQERHRLGVAFAENPAGAGPRAAPNQSLRPRETSP